MSRGPGQPRLAPGEETVLLQVRIPARDRELLDRAAAAVGESRSEYVRDVLAVAACDELGLEPLEWMTRRREEPRPPRERSDEERLAEIRAATKRILAEIRAAS